MTGTNLRVLFRKIDEISLCKYLRESCLTQGRAGRFVATQLHFAEDAFGLEGLESCSVSFQHRIVAPSLVLGPVDMLDLLLGRFLDRRVVRFHLFVLNVLEFFQSGSFLVKELVLVGVSEAELPELLTRGGCLAWVR